MLGVKLIPYLVSFLFVMTLIWFIAFLWRVGLYRINQSKIQTGIAIKTEVKEEIEISKLISIGFGGSIPSDIVVAIVKPDSAPIRRKIEEARQSGYCIDATFGRKTRTVVFTKSNHVILSAIQSETIQKRYNEDIITVEK